MNKKVNNDRTDEERIEWLRNHADDIVSIGVIIMMLAAFLLSGCNKQIVDVNWKFTIATIDYGDHSVTYEVKSWNDYENSDVVQIVDTDGHVHLTHYSNVVLEN